MEPLPFSRILICLILVLSLCQDSVEAQSKPCTLPTSEPGECVAIQRCRNIHKILRSPKQSQKYSTYIKRAACTLPGVTRSICCSPQEVVPIRKCINKHNLLPEDCGQRASDRISHGNATEVFDYPWMAVLQYNETGRIVDRCGGSLINKRYVLTAAHCIKTTSMFQLHSVILGEHTKNQTEDCIIFRDNNGKEIDRDCADPIEEFGIESVVMHQDYNRPKYSNDIGLIRLNRDVTMKDHIQPICLPVTESLRTQTFSNYIVIGWGTTENSSGSDVLLEAILNHAEIATCQREMTRLRTTVVLSDKQICAQGKGFVDCCKGDSGGPLISSANYALGVDRYVQLGIVSAGIDSCGQRSAAGIYCRVASYMDWILEHIECDE